MISTKIFWQTLTDSNFSFFSGVPCSILKPILNNQPPEIRYVSAVREDSALGVCSGAFLCGKKSVVMMQNSGLGNIVNALTSFSLVYKIPVLLIITWRGEPGKADAPEHEVMGKVMLPILNTLGIPYKIIDGGFPLQIRWAEEEMRKSQTPVALILREGIVE